MKYKYILFDWDGTLGKTLDVWFECIKKHLNKRDIYPTDDQIVKGFGDWEFGIKMGVTDNDTFIKELLEEVNKKLLDVELYNNVFSILETLKLNGVKTALVTSSVRPSVTPALEKYNLSKFFNTILTGEDVINHKPDPEMLYKAMKNLGAVKEETIIVGDGPKDIGAGKNAGIKTVCFYPEDNKKFYNEADIKSFDADFVINDLLEILDIVQ